MNLKMWSIVVVVIIVTSLFGVFTYNKILIAKDVVVGQIGESGISTSTVTRKIIKFQCHLVEDCKHVGWRYWKAEEACTNVDVEVRGYEIPKFSEDYNEFCKQI